MTNNDEGNIRRECGVSHARRRRSLVGFLVSVAFLIAGGWAAYDSIRSGGENHEIKLSASEYDPVQEFVSEYYEASGSLVFENTYALLDDEARSRISEDDWTFAQKARYFEEDATSPPLSAEVVDSETFGESIVADLLVTYEDGSREEISGFAMSINSATGGIERSLTDEGVGYLMGLVNEHRGDNEFEVYRDCPDDPDGAQYGANCDIATSVSSPVMTDVAEDAMRDTTTSTGAINPEETTEGTTADVIVDNIEDAMRDTTTATRATNESAIEDLMVEDTAEASGNEGTSVEDTSVEETSVEGASFEEASVVGRLVPLAVMGGGVAIMVGLVLVGRFLWLRW